MFLDHCSAYQDTGPGQSAGQIRQFSNSLLTVKSLEALGLYCGTEEPYQLYWQSSYLTAKNGLLIRFYGLTSLVKTLGRNHADSR